MFQRLFYPRSIPLFLLVMGAVSCTPVRQGPVEWCELPTQEEASAYIEIASPADRGRLGEGWSRGEKKGRYGYRWLKRLESDIRFEFHETDESVTCWMMAAPLYIDWKQQRIALYVNGAFATEWTCPLEYDFYLYRADLPGKLFREGENTLTLRAGYCRRLAGDDRNLSFALDKIVLQVNAAGDG